MPFPNPLITEPAPVSLMVNGQVVLFARDYTRDPVLSRQYEKGAGLQWQVGDPALFDWRSQMEFARPVLPDDVNPFSATPHWGALTSVDGSLEELRRDTMADLLSQSLHAEQGGLNATALITAALEGCDDKMVAALQVADEARHVEFFRHAVARVGKSYPSNPSLQKLIEQGMLLGKLHLKFISIQILVEGLALAAFNSMRKALDAARVQHGGGDAVLRTGLDYIIQDEARHVAFGIESLSRMFQGVSQQDRREASDFVFDGFRLMQERLVPRAVCEERGLDPDEVFSPVRMKSMPMFTRSLVSGVLPKALRLGLVPDDHRDLYASQYGVDWSIVGRKAAEL